LLQGKKKEKNLNGIFYNNKNIKYYLKNYIYFFLNILYYIMSRKESARKSLSYTRKIREGDYLGESVYLRLIQLYKENDELGKRPTSDNILQINRNLDEIEELTREHPDAVEDAQYTLSQEGKLSQEEILEQQRQEEQRQREQDFDPLTFLSPSEIQQQSSAKPSQEQRIEEERQRVEQERQRQIAERKAQDDELIIGPHLTPLKVSKPITIRAQDNDKKRIILTRNKICDDIGDILNGWISEPTFYEQTIIPLAAYGLSLISITSDSPQTAQQIYERFSGEYQSNRAETLSRLDAYAYRLLTLRINAIPREILAEAKEREIARTEEERRVLPEYEFMFGMLLPYIQTQLVYNREISRSFYCVPPAGEPEGLIQGFEFSTIIPIRIQEALKCKILLGENSFGKLVFPTEGF
jgi:hypothetical protein